jgi:hypothetical protein
MQRLQKWFEQLAGIDAAARQKQDIVARALASRPVDPLLLTRPACWRRKALIR